MTCDKLEIPFNDTWDMTFRVRDPQTNSLISLTGTSVTMYVHDERGKEIASVDCTVNETDKTWTVTLDADFWSHFGTIAKIKEAIYTARFQATTGDEVVTYPNEDPYFKIQSIVIEKIGSKLYDIVYEKRSYTLEMVRGARSEDVWDWGTVEVPDTVDIVYDALFRKVISPILYLDGAPVKWSAVGITQNKRDQPGEEDETPYLDFTGYTINEGEFQGTIDFQFKG